MRIFIWVFLSLSLFFSIPTITQSSSIYRSTQKTIHHFRPDPVYRIKWKEQTKTTTSGGKTSVKKIILNDSVCYNYRKGSIKYRGCREQARKHFRDKCDYFKDKYKSTTKPYNEEFKVKKNMFCLAGSNFQP